MQTEIANAVGSALKVTLLGDVDAKIQVGGTRNPAAFDAYLRASNAYWTGSEEEAYRAAIASYGEAIRLDPDFALAYADRSFVLADFAQGAAKGPAIRDLLNRAQADALKAIALAPELAEGHFGLAVYYSFNVDFPRANSEYQRALELAPGNAKLLIIYGLFATSIGQHEAGLAAAHRSVALDPLNPWYRVWLGAALTNARRYADAIATYKDVLSRAKNDVGLKSQTNAWLGYAYYLSGDFDNARASCESAEGDLDDKTACLAMTYEKLKRHADAKTMLDRVQASSLGVDHPVWCAIIFAQWGDSDRGVDWLEKAMRLRDPHLVYMRTPFLDPLRKEPRFQAIERELKFPD
jgi:serine/threonine-protein kinase